MINEDTRALETALAGTTASADTLRRAADRLVATVKALRGDLATGALKDLPRRWEACEASLALVQQELANAKSRWRFSLDAYSPADYIQELLQAARAEGLHAAEQDGVIFCYPAMVRINLAEPSVQIDRRKRLSSIRPSFVAKELKKLRDRPVRFRAAQFLEALFTTYRDMVPGFQKSGVAHGPVVRVVDVYDRWVRRPLQDKEYPIQEFARDIYLLDRERLTTTRTGCTLSLPASTGTRGTRGYISVLTESGTEKRYYGLSFAR